MSIGTFFILTLAILGFFVGFFKGAHKPVVPRRLTLEDEKSELSVDEEKIDDIAGILIAMEIGKRDAKKYATMAVVENPLEIDNSTLVEIAFNKLLEDGKGF